MCGHTTVGRVFGLLVENQPQRVVLTANVLNKQSRKTYILWSSSLETVRFLTL